MQLVAVHMARVNCAAQQSVWSNRVTTPEIHCAPVTTQQPYNAKPNGAPVRRVHSLSSTNVPAWLAAAQQLAAAAAGAAGASTAPVLLASLLQGLALGFVLGPVGFLAVNLVKGDGWGSSVLDLWLCCGEVGKLQTVWSNQGCQIADAPVVKDGQTASFMCAVKSHSTAEPQSKLLQPPFRHIVLSGIIPSP